jgi:hypothetical protein
MIATDLSTPYAVSSPAPAASSALSSWARVDRRDIDGSELDTSLFFASGQREAERQLRLISLECDKPDWDGYGATAVSVSALQHALAFVELLPSYVSEPQASAHPDGELALTWTRNELAILSIAISSTGRLSYAYLNGYQRKSGREFLTSTLPRSIEQLLQEISASSRT